MVVGGQRHAPPASPPGLTHYPLSRGLGGLRAGLDRCGNLAAPGIRSPERPARNESVYRAILAHRGIAELVLNLSSDGKWLVAAPRRSGRMTKKKVFACVGNRTQDRPFRSLFIIQTVLFRVILKVRHIYIYIYIYTYIHSEVY
jgi:hypothetical protein